MNHESAQKDLVALTADKDMEFALRGLLNRQHALGIRSIEADIFVHPERDPGCYLRCHDFLSSMIRKYSRAIILFDHDGCGAEDRTRVELESEVEDRLGNSRWKNRCAAIVIDPELEIWVWSDSPHVAEILGWRCPNSSLKQWLQGKELWNLNAAKPHSPKQAMEATLKKSRLPRSAMRYKQLAERVGLERCVDVAFQKLKTTLKSWFPS